MDSILDFNRDEIGLAVAQGQRKTLEAQRNGVLQGSSTDNGHFGARYKPHVADSASEFAVGGDGSDDAALVDLHGAKIDNGSHKIS